MLNSVDMLFAKFDILLIVVCMFLHQSAVANVAASEAACLLSLLDKLDHIEMLLLLGLPDEFTNIHLNKVLHLIRAVIANNREFVAKATTMSS